LVNDEGAFEATALKDAREVVLTTNMVRYDAMQRDESDKP
jgi:hypothetical protein